MENKTRKSKEEVKQELTRSINGDERYENEDPVSVTRPYKMKLLRRKKIT